MVKALLSAGLSTFAPQLAKGQAGAVADVYDLGLSAYRSGDTSLAIASFEQAIELEPGNADALLYLGMAHTRLGQNAEAVRYLKDARDLHPNYWDVRVALARSLVGTGEVSAALDELSIVLETVPGHIDATHLKARIDNRIVDSLPSEPSAQARRDELAAAFEQGLAAYRIGDARKASESFERALQLSPDNVDALLFLGTVYSWRKRFDEALGLLGRARDLDPSYADVAIAIARVKLWQGKLEAAKQEIQSLLEVAPQRHDAVAVKEQIERKMKSVEIAGDLLREAGRARAVPTSAPLVEPDYSPTLTDSPGPGALPAPTETDELITTDSQLSAANVPLVVAAFGQGMEAFRLGDSSKAIDAFERVLGQDPTHVEARMFLGIVLGWEEQFERALEELRLARHERVEYPDADVAIARILMWQGELDEAVVHVDEVLKIYPDHSEAQVVRAEISKRHRPKWRADIVYERSSFDDERSDWDQTSVALSYKPGGRSSYTLALLGEDRGYATDQMSTFSTYHGSDNWGLSFQLGVTSAPDFKEDWHVAAGIRHRAREGGLDVGDTWFALEVREAEYTVGNVSTVKLGIEQYVMANRMWLTTQGIFVIDEVGDHLAGWSARLDLTSGPLSFFVGGADAPETEFGETVDTRTLFGGVTYSFWDRYAFRLAYTREDRKDRYVRKAITSVLTANF